LSKSASNARAKEDVAATLLLVDDDVDIRETCADILHDAGYRVIEASNGKEALAVLEARTEHPPRIILLDLLMPVMDGFAFLAARENDSGLRKIPVVVMTAISEMNRSKIHHDLTRFLAKPFDMRDLLEVAEQYCGH